MAKRTLNRLSAREAERLKTPGRHSDGGSLCLRHRRCGPAALGVHVCAPRSSCRAWPWGWTRHVACRSADRSNSPAYYARQWRRPQGGSREKRSYSDLRRMRRCLCRGHVRPLWRSAKHAAQWSMTLKTYAEPIRSRPVDEISTQDILDILQPLWKRVPETAMRLRGRIENVLDAAKAKGQRSGENPARWRGHLDQLLPKRQRLRRGHHAALPTTKSQRLWSSCRSRPALTARGPGIHDPHQLPDKRGLGRYPGRNRYRKKGPGDSRAPYEGSARASGAAIYEKLGNHRGDAGDGHGGLFVFPPQ